MSTQRRTLVATAPTRLDFGGGWTDVPPYPEERGGFVCNLAIERRATVRMELDDAESGTLAGELTAEFAAETASPPAWNTTDPMVRAALTRAGITNVRVQLTSDFPVGAGLGGSSAAGVALAAAVHAWQHQSVSAGEVAEWSRAVEVEELGIAGGFQDHYAAAFGGALGLTFAETNSAEMIPLRAGFTRTLEQRILLLYTGESRISSATITAVRDAYRDRVPRVIQALARMGELARDMRDALVHENIDQLAACVREHWHHQRALHPAITTERIDAIEHAAYGAGASAMKALGASGGGCVIVCTPPECLDRVVRAVSPFAARLHWRVALTGVTVR